MGSRPVSGASLERRRRWAASGRLPPALAARFTLAEPPRGQIIRFPVAVWAPRLWRNKVGQVAKTFAERKTETTIARVFLDD